MEEKRVSIDEFEKCIARGEAEYKSVLIFKLIKFIFLSACVIAFFMVPKTFWLIPSHYTKEKLNPYSEPVMIKNWSNISATDLKRREDYSKLVKIKSLVKNRKTFYILPLAEYSITGRIKAKNRIFLVQTLFDDVALLDYGLTWGDMAKDKYFKKIRAHSMEIIGARQLSFGIDRKYYNEMKDMYPYMIKHVSHTHVIPANRNIRKALNASRYGQIVKIEGYLVDVYDSNYRRFAMSSLSLEDSNDSSRGNGKGGGACEVMYVNKIQIGNKIFE